MEALKPFFPVSFGAKDITALIIRIVMYVVVGVIVGLLCKIIGIIPVIGGVIGWIVGGVVGLYCLIGIIVLVLDFLQNKK